MILKSIEIKNFKAIKYCKFDLTSVTLLVGANNAGKSSILQAIHFASTLMRSAAEPNKQSTLSLNSADYVPTESYRELAHGANIWGNASGASQSEVKFTFFDATSAATATAGIIIKAARNEGLSLDPNIPQNLFDRFRKREQFFSAYIPGLAGIPLQEQYLTSRHVFKKVASGDSNVVLRNILLMIKRDGKLNELLKLLNEIYVGVSITVDFDEKKDFFIMTHVSLTGATTIKKPIEFSGTGLLQIVQIFAYLVLFRPVILLIDEPESHLHPTMQVRLIRTLEKKAREIGAIVLITTHSPFVAQGLPLGSRSVWVREGAIVASSDGDEIKQALGWGAIDRKYILCTEDGSKSLLERILKQRPDTFDKVAIVPFDGCSKLGSGAPLKSLRSALGNSHKVIVHRDRDCMSDTELDQWTSEMKGHGLTPWVTNHSDIEAYFCEPRNIAAIYGIASADAEKIMNEALADNEGGLKDEFFNKRKEVNKKIYEKTGGSPSSDILWDTEEVLRKVKGKTFISKLRANLKAGGFDEKKITQPASEFVVAEDLFLLFS